MSSVDREKGAEASRTWVIKAALMMGFPFVVRKTNFPSRLQSGITKCERHI
jgi:hypothetical protein